MASVASPVVDFLRVGDAMASGISSSRFNSDGGSSYVGRVGALAVALGIGAAVVALPGLAVADTQGSGGAAGSVAASDSAAGVARGSAHERGRAARSSRSGSAGGAAGPVAGRTAAVRPVRIPVTGAGSSSAGGGGAPSAAASVRTAGPVVRGPVARALPAVVLPGVASVAGPSAASSVESGGSGGSVSALVAGRDARQAAAVAFPTPVALPTPAQVRALAEGVVRRAFNAAENWLLNYAGSPVAGFLEGALVLVRRSLFNQAPLVIPTVPSTGQDGLIRGQLGAIDEEGDALIYSVLEAPKTGTVTVDTDGLWAFTPGADYSGKDAFTVRITPQGWSLNLLNPGNDGSRTVTINVGDLTQVDAPDVGVYLAGASGQLTVKRTFTGYRASVALSDVTSDTLLKWMDTSGRMGNVSLGSVESVYWPQFQAKAADNGATVSLLLAYAGAGGEKKAVLLQDVGITKDAGGQYVLSGALAPNPAINPDGVDVWDVAGKDAKPRYDAFRSDYGIDGGWLGRLAPISVDFSKADVFAYTLTPNSYQQAGMYAQDSEVNKQAAGPGAGATPVPGATADATADATANATGNVKPVTGSVSDGRTVIITRNDGSVESWTDGQKTFLNNPADYITPSETPVSVTLLRGDTLIVAHTDDGNGRIEAWTGNQERLLTPKPGPSFPQSWKGTVNTLLEYDRRVTDADGNTVYGTGFVAGLSNGSVQLWSDTTNDWIQLHDSGWKAGVTTMISYGDGFVLGLDNGSVQKWNGPGASTDTATWANNWQELQASVGSGVTAMLPYKAYPNTKSCGTAGCDGFLIGLGNGAVQRYSEANKATETTAGAPGFTTLENSGQYFNASPVKGIVLSDVLEKNGLPLFAVGLQDGTVAQYGLGYAPFDPNGGGWTVIQRPGKDGWNSEITSMTQYGQNFIVGLKNSAVEMRVNPGAGNPYGASGASSWVELRPNGDNGGWGSRVNRIVPVESATADAGVYAGLQNGSVQKWSGLLSGNSGENQWTELQSSSWNSWVNSINQTGFNGGITVGLDNGKLQQWTPQEGKAPQDSWIELKYDDPVFISGVSKVVSYDQPIKDGDGNQVDSSFTGYIVGNKLTVTSLGVGSTVKIGSLITGEETAITDGGPLIQKVESGTRIIKYIAPSEQCIDSNCPTTDSAPGSGSGYTGVYEVSIAQTAGSSVPRKSLEDPSVELPAGLTMTQTGIPAVTPATVVVLDNGKMLLRSSSSDQWITLRDMAWPTGGSVSAILPYKEGVVVGLNNGAVVQWTGPGTSSDPGTWKANWTLLHDDGWKSGVTALTSFRDKTGLCTGNCDNGFVVGLNNGSVQQYNDATGWNELQGLGWDSPVKGIVLSRYDGAGRPTIAVGVQNGGVYQWTGAGKTWDTIQKPGTDGWGTEITAMSQFGENFIVGLKNSAVEMRVNPAPATFVSSGGGAVTTVPVTVSLRYTYTQGVGSINQTGSSSKARMDFALPTGATPSSFVGATVATAAQPNAAIGTITSYGFTTLKTVYDSPAGSVYTVGLNNPTYFQNVSSQPLILTQTGPTSCKGCYNPNPVGQPSEVQFPQGAISNGVGSASGNVLQVVVPSDWITSPATELASGTCGLCSDMRGGTISGSGIEGATIGGFLGVGPGSLASFEISGDPQLVGTQLPGRALQLNSSPGVDPAALVGQKVVGIGIPDGTTITGVRSNTPEGGVIYEVSKDVLVTAGTTVLTPGYYPDGKTSTWAELHDNGWGKFGQVNQIVPFKNADIGNGAIVGLNNGSVQLWNGKQPGQSNWTELHDAGWGSAVTTISLAKSEAIDDSGNAGYQDGVIVGLANGATEQWAGAITGKTGQNDWIQLAGYSNFAKDALAPKGPWTCTDNWKCSNPGALQQAVDFGEVLAAKTSTPPMFDPFGVGGKADPIFSNPNLLAGSTVNGVYVPIAFATNYQGGRLGYASPDPITAGGSIMPYDFAKQYGYVAGGVDPCGAGKGTQCSVLVLTSVDPKPPKGFSAIFSESPSIIGAAVAANDLDLDAYFAPNALITSSKVPPETRIEAYLGQTSSNSWAIGTVPAGLPRCGTGNNTCTVYTVSDPSGLPTLVKADGPKDQNLQISAAPSIRAGIDIAPVAYGYLYMPDGFVPKFKAGNWSVGAMFATKIGPSITANLGPNGEIWGYETKPVSYKAYSPGPLGIDSMGVEAGVKVKADLSLTGAQKPSVNVHAYTVPGTVFTLNSAGAPGEMQMGFNNYLDVNFEALKTAITGGLTVTVTATPYVNLVYGIIVPAKIPVIGGWSFFKLSGGIENPISATGCISFKAGCSLGGINNVGNYYGVINNGKFTGLLNTADTTPGNILTVTQKGLLGHKPVVGELLQGPGVATGTRITRVLGDDQYEVGVCDPDGKTCESKPQNVGGATKFGSYPALTSYSPGSYASTTIGAQGNLAFHVGALEALTSLLTFDAKIPLYNFNLTLPLDYMYR